MSSVLGHIIPVSSLAALCQWDVGCWDRSSLKSKCPERDGFRLFPADSAHTHRLHLICKPFPGYEDCAGEDVSPLDLFIRGPSD